ncbi:hypothetical protein WICPIJ_007611 [Wickerhamomyces pijperi]|uniref:Uncharacterized protein n=1 Tax=Wickerhamomyces pijperi TaxID=599730 RepID=A0A9P8TJT6_WICPI|nr:hypothetical protein WICPIJ_007611 [Wickerhamomyces pijperi]
MANGVDFPIATFLEGNTATSGQDPILRSNTNPNKDRSGSSESNPTRTCDDEHSDGKLQGPNVPTAEVNVQIGSRQSSAETKRQPDDPSENGQEHNNWDEITSDDIGDSFNGGSFHLPVSDGFDDLIDQ